MSDESHAPEERNGSSLAELQRPSAPGRDLWPQIEAQINAERAPRAAAARTASRHAGQHRVVAWRSLAAAAMVASVAVGVWIGRSVLPTTGLPATPSPLSASRASPGPIDAPTARAAAYVSDPRYQR